MVSEEVFLDIYSIHREKKKRGDGGREAEVCWSIVMLYVLHWGRWTPREGRVTVWTIWMLFSAPTLSQTEAAFLLSLAWLDSEALDRTHTHTHTHTHLLLHYGMIGVCFLAEVLPEDI